LRRVLAETDAPSVNVRDTAERDTPARSATSFNVIAMVGKSPIWTSRSLCSARNAAYLYILRAIDAFYCLHLQPIAKYWGCVKF
jgi:hypothetical protein